MTFVSVVFKNVTTQKKKKNQVYKNDNLFFFFLRRCAGGVKALGCCRFPKINTGNGQQGEALQRYIHKCKRRHECGVCV